MVRGFLGHQDQSVGSDISVEDFYSCSIILEMFHYCTTIVLVSSCFPVNVQFFSPCFLCPPFKIKTVFTPALPMFDSWAKAHGAASLHVLLVGTCLLPLNCCSTPHLWG